MLEDFLSIFSYSKIKDVDHEPVSLKIVPSQKPENLAVQIVDGCKSYGKLEVLKNLKLNVPSGAIYGLLGPSGCGKFKG